MSVLLAVQPLAGVGRSLFHVSAFAVKFAFHPAALVVFTVDVRDLTVAMGKIVDPFALVVRTVGPKLRTLAVAQAAAPLSRVLGPAAHERVFGPLHALLLCAPRFGIFKILFAAWICRRI